MKNPTMMKKAIVTSSLLLLLVCAAFGQSDLLTPKTNSPKTKLTYDKFQDESRVETPDLDLKPTGDSAILFNQIQLSGVYLFQGQTLKADPRFAMLFVVRSGDWRYLEADKRQLILLADGKRIIKAESSGKHDGSTSASYGKVETIEYLVFGFTRTELQEIIKAKVIEMQLGSAETVITDKDKEYFQALLDSAVVK